MRAVSATTDASRPLEAPANAAATPVFLDEASTTLDDALDIAAQLGITIPHLLGRCQVGTYVPVPGDPEQCFMRERHRVTVRARGSLRASARPFDGSRGAPRAGWLEAHQAQARADDAPWLEYTPATIAEEVAHREAQPNPAQRRDGRRHGWARKQSLPLGPTEEQAHRVAFCQLTAPERLLSLRGPQAGASLFSDEPTWSSDGTGQVDVVILEKTAPGGDVQPRTHHLEIHAHETVGDAMGRAFPRAYPLPPPARPADARLGRHCKARFARRPVVGQGTFGTVVLDTFGGDPVALKRLRPLQEFAYGRHAARTRPMTRLQPEERNALVYGIAREISLTQRLRGLPGTLQARAVAVVSPAKWMGTRSRTGGAVYISMPVADGGSMYGTYHRRPAAVVGDMIALYHTLDQMAGRGIVHRDLKPGNLGRAGGRPVILDFGACEDTLEWAGDGVFPAGRGSAAYLSGHGLSGLPAAHTDWVTSGQESQRNAFPMAFATAEDVYGMAAAIGETGTKRGPYHTPGDEAAYRAARRHGRPAPDKEDYVTGWKTPGPGDATTWYQSHLYGGPGGDALAALLGRCLQPDFTDRPTARRVVRDAIVLDAMLAAPRK